MVSIALFITVFLVPILTILALTLGIKHCLFLFRVAVDFAPTLLVSCCLPPFSVYWGGLAFRLPFLCGRWFDPIRLLARDLPLKIVVVRDTLHGINTDSLKVH